VTSWCVRARCLLQRKTMRGLARLFVRCWKKIIVQCDNREETIRRLLPLVKKIGRRVACMVQGTDTDDLIGEGSIELIRAVDSFDPQRGPSLEQYASHIIAGAMLNGIRRLDPVSERVRRDIREAERERYALATQRGELPTMREMEERRPGLQRARMHAYRYTPLSLDGPLPGGERLGTDWYSDPGRIVEQESSHSDVRSALQRLPARQRRVLMMHYFGDISLHAVGRKLLISPQRASQLHLAALANLRKACQL